MKHLLAVFLLGVLFSLSACVKNEDGKLEVTAGYWGNHIRLNDFHNSRIFLINVTKKQNYKICLPKYLSEKYEGIENELSASVHIWGYYIGRDINLKIDVTDLPVPDLHMEADKILDLYKPLCPKNSDLIIGEAIFLDSTLGETFYTYLSDSKGKVMSATRGLFLKRSGDEADKIWVTLSQYLKKPLAESDILEMMKSRNEIFYLDNQPAHITLVTIAHEIGHVWGMCDQYNLGLGITNCDRKHSSLDEAGKIQLDLDSIMSSSSWENKIFLTDDDIEGIRHLANRKEFIHGYPAGEEINKIDVIKRPDSEAIPVLNLKSVTIVKEGAKFDFSLVTTVPIKIEYKYFEKNEKEPIVNYDEKLDKPIKQKSHKFTGTLKAGRKIIWDRFEITFQAMSEDGELVGDPFLIEYQVPQESKKVP